MKNNICTGKINQSIFYKDNSSAKRDTASAATYT